MKQNVKLHSVKELMTLRPPDLIEGLLGPGDVMTITGDTTPLKSIIAVDMAVCAAIGLPWFGRFNISRPLRVLLTTSHGRHCMGNRVVAAMYGKQELLPNIMDLHVAFDVPNLYQGTNSFVYATPKNPDILVLDGLGSALGDGPEDEHRALRAFRRMCLQLDCAGVVTHFNHLQGDITVQLFGTECRLNGKICPFKMVKGKKGRYITWPQTE